MKLIARSQIWSNGKRKKNALFTDRHTEVHCSHCKAWIHGLTDCGMWIHRLSQSINFTISPIKLYNFKQLNF